jgi:hypothetical protein
MGEHLIADPNTVREKAYDSIDEFLSKIHSGESTSMFDLQDYPANVESVMREVFDKYELLNYPPQAPGNKTTSFPQLSREGLTAVNDTIRIYLARHERRSERDEAIQEMTHQTLKWEQLPKRYWIWPLVINAVLAGLVAWVVSYYAKT